MAQRHPIYIGLMYQGYVIIQSPLSVHILCISAHVLSVFEEIGIPIGILGHSKVILMTKVPQFLRERRDCKYSLYKLFLRLLKRWVEFCKLIWKKSNIWKLGMTCVSHLSQGCKNRGHHPTPQYFEQIVSVLLCDTAGQTKNVPHQYLSVSYTQESVVCLRS